MKSYEYIEKVKEFKGLDTDYKAAKLMGWSPHKIYQYRDGQSMDNEAARQVAEILGIPLIKIIADMEVQRAKNERQRNAWLKLSKLTNEAGQASTNLLISLAIFSAGSVYCILCKITDIKLFSHYGTNVGLIFSEDM